MARIKSRELLSMVFAVAFCSVLALLSASSSLSSSLSVMTGASTTMEPPIIPTKEQESSDDGIPLTGASTTIEPRVIPTNQQASSDDPTTRQDPSHESFPLTLHYIWPDKDFSFGSDDPNGVEQRRTLELVNRIKKNNPEWQVNVWTDDDCYAFVKEHFPDFYQNWTALTPRLKMWDAVRPMILYIHGGIYLDHDIDCDEGVHFSDWITPETTLLLREPQHDRSNLGNHFMGSAPKHSIWKIYLDNIVKDTRKNPPVTRHTGPKQLYPTFLQYIEGIPDQSQLRLLGYNEIGTSEECEKAAHGNETFCAQPRCNHKHFVSPAELAGEDDNAKGQINGFRKRVGLPPLKFTQVKCTCRRFHKFLNETQPVVFVHTPKTGGTTIEKLMGYAGSCHATAFEMKACNPDEYEKALSFAALRHPIERIISIYRYAQKGGNGNKRDKKKFGFVNGLNFSSFVEALPSQREINFAPQTHFIMDPDRPSTLLVDELICTEDLNAGWERLTTLAPTLKKYGKFPKAHLRVTPLKIPKFAADQVDSATVERLREMYRDDFALWEKHCGKRDISLS